MKNVQWRLNSGFDMRWRCSTNSWNGMGRRGLRSSREELGKLGRGLKHYDSTSRFVCFPFLLRFVWLLDIWTWTWVSQGMDRDKLFYLLDSRHVLLNQTWQLMLSIRTSVRVSELKLAVCFWTLSVFPSLTDAMVFDTVISMYRFSWNAGQIIRVLRPLCNVKRNQALHSLVVRKTYSDGWELLP